jgi:hypothetical protein
LRTTTRSSERRKQPFGARSPARGAGLALLALLIGCAAPRHEPKELLQLSPESPQQRATQTRLFDTSDGIELLSASAAALQDLGFQVQESVPDLGVLRAAKERSAREYGQEISRSLIALLSTAGLVFGSNTLVIIPVDLHQQINASLVARPVDEGGSRHEVRVLFYRVVWKGSGQSGDQQIPPGQQKMEMIRDPEIYQQFFARLSKAVFLEAHKI